MRGTATLPASKSESNRVLILQALAGGGTLENLSDANDTQLMRRLLAHPEASVVDAEDAGTVMRFLTAYLAVTGRQVTLTGTARMCERPIGVLVDALRQLGAVIDYVDRQGYPPLRLRGWEPTESAPLQVRGDISSQFISALMMIGPLVPGGLQLQLTGHVGSRPYIQMTAELMRHFGADVEAGERTVRVGTRPYQPADYHVESDWSAASYWYSMVALAPSGSQVRLPGLRRQSLQGDQVVRHLMESLGVRTEFVADGVELHQLAPEERSSRVAMNFTDCPDLAQTIAVAAAATGVVVDMTGLESLRIKETDRIAALQTELAKVGATLTDIGDAVFQVKAADFRVADARIATYHDHRMAMAFAPLALRGPLTIDRPAVVRKSYPFFWEELRQAGFTLE
ncbi:3-phosphoshikimate 1-carboxyvinyltransferase [Hymenobacter busanensis]|uniref:3-phosphoshikimate 1-carboxyvinyltransferase n=1 Tax=Hymenobacter busanensis TaxID=2607656 RepID=A0A7L5A2B5_9BACT|nr:3-phosphoshikimate 1-carboxyvinyltransferase [Hymenobacter busanensis]QHJ09651.1 3-phosphoshikimate 1-carboxyvinyltransferase [Hymenobacter busanensis]